MQLLKIGSTRLVLHPFFLLLMVLYGVAGLLPMALTVFSVVLLHEIGHSVAACYYHLAVEEIELLPFGGVAKIQGLYGVNPDWEANIAAAGPFTNLLLILGAMLIQITGWVGREHLGFFIEVNFVIAFFNLIPALPLDGGRILRAVWSRRFGFYRATLQAAMLGKAFAVVIFVAGLLLLQYDVFAVNLLVVSLFLWMAARSEGGNPLFAAIKQISYKKENLKTGRSYPATGIVAAPGTPLRRILPGFLPQTYGMVYAVDERTGETAVLTEEQIISGLVEKGYEAKVGDVIKR